MDYPGMYSSERPVNLVPVSAEQSAHFSYAQHPMYRDPHNIANASGRHMYHAGHLVPGLWQHQREDPIKVNTFFIWLHLTNVLWLKCYVFYQFFWCRLFQGDYFFCLFCLHLTHPRPYFDHHLCNNLLQMFVICY